MRNALQLLRFILSIRFFLFITAATILCSFSRCKKDDEPQLPPETTTGAMTFGCKINGKVFVPRDGNGHPGLFCQYVFLGNGLGEGWHLNIPAINWESSDIIQLTTDSLLVIEGNIYEFKLDDNYKKVKGTAFAGGNIGSIPFLKLSADPGSMTITKLDPINRILSGTFFFTGTNVSTGEKVSITDGRFDIRY